MKIGVIGGTFNPVHTGHLRIAEEVRDRLVLDQVIFMPAATPPHKPLAGELPFSARLEMVRLAIADNPAFSVSDMEERRGGLSYSIDTLRALTAHYRGDELYFIIGSDSFLDMGSWHQYDAIFACCHVVVVERPGYVVAEPGSAVPPAIAHRFRAAPGGGALAHDSGFSVFYFSGIHLDISSSRIRELVRHGRSIRYLVPAAVEEYIKQERLYADA